VGSIPILSTNNNRKYLINSYLRFFITVLLRQFANRSFFSQLTYIHYICSK